MNPPRLRVVFLITQFETGGAQAQVWLRLKHIDRARFDCRVALLTDVAAHQLDRVRALGVPVDVLHVDREAALWRRVARVRDYLVRVAPDVVNTVLTWDHVYGAMGAALAGVPLIVSELQNDIRNLRRGYSWAFQALEAFALRLVSDRVVCCSQAAYLSYTRALPGLAPKARVIPNAIDVAQPYPSRDEARRALGLPLDRPIIGAIGRLAAQKDLPTLLRAAKAVLSRHPDALFALAGTGPRRDQLVALRDELGLTRSVAFLGDLQDPYAFHAAIDVFAMSSQWEGLPVVLLEAMAAGRPSVCTTVGGVPEVLQGGRSGFLVPPGDPAALAEELCALLDSPERRERMGANAIEDVAAFSVRPAVALWEAVYSEGRSTPRRSSGVASGLPARVSRMLLWRLCPIDTTLRIAAEIAGRHPGVEIDCLCQPAVAAVLREAGINPIIYGEGRFTAASLDIQTLSWLRNRRYDAVLLPFNHVSRQGYFAAEVIASWIGRGAAIGVKAWDGRVEIDGRLGVWRAIGARLGGPVVDAARSALVLASSAVSAGRAARA